MFYVYLIQCKTPFHIYIGLTARLHRRIHQHEIGNGAFFTRKHGFSYYIVLDTFDLEADAKKFEWEIVQELGNDPQLTVRGAGRTQV